MAFRSSSTTKVKFVLSALLAALSLSLLHGNYFGAGEAQSFQAYGYQVQVGTKQQQSSKVQLKDFSSPFFTNPEQWRRDTFGNNVTGGNSEVGSGNNTAGSGNTAASGNDNTNTSGGDASSGNDGSSSGSKGGCNCYLKVCGKTGGAAVALLIVIIVVFVIVLTTSIVLCCVCKKRGAKRRAAARAAGRADNRENTVVHINTAAAAAPQPQIVQSVQSQVVSAPLIATGPVAAPAPVPLVQARPVVMQPQPYGQQLVQPYPAPSHTQVTQVVETTPLLVR